MKKLLFLSLTLTICTSVTFSQVKIILDTNDDGDADDPGMVAILGLFYFGEDGNLGGLFYPLALKAWRVPCGHYLKNKLMKNFICFIGQGYDVSGFNMTLHRYMVSGGTIMMRGTGKGIPITTGCRLTCCCCTTLHLKCSMD